MALVRLVGLGDAAAVWLVKWLATLVSVLVISVLYLVYYIGTAIMTTLLVLMMALTIMTTRAMIPLSSAFEGGTITEQLQPGADRNERLQRY